MGIANQRITPGRTTLVEGCNSMLESIGESPVASLEDDTNAMASMAERKLLETHRSEQVRGWSWNKHRRFFYRDTSTGEIVIPANVISFSPDPLRYARRYTARGQRVFDTQRGTYEMEETEIEASIIESLAWNETPEVFNYFSIVKASIAFGQQVLGNEPNSYLASEVQRAWSALLAVETREAQPNVLTDGYEMDPFSTFHPSLGAARRSSSRRYV